MNEPNGTPLDTYARRVKELEKENDRLTERVREMEEARITLLAETGATITDLEIALEARVAALKAATEVDDDH